MHTLQTGARVRPRARAHTHTHQSAGVRMWARAQRTIGPPVGALARGPAAGAVRGGDARRGPAGEGFPEEGSLSRWPGHGQPGGCGAQAGRSKALPAQPEPTARAPGGPARVGGRRRGRPSRRLRPAGCLGPGRGGRGGGRMRAGSAITRGPAAARRQRMRRRRRGRPYQQRRWQRRLSRRPGSPATSKTCGRRRGADRT